MSEPTSAVTAIFWKPLMKLIPAIVGALIGALAMKYPDGTSFGKKLATFAIAFISGVAVSHFVGAAIIAYFPGMDEVIYDAIKFALGVFGLTLVNNIISEMSLWMTSLRKKIFGAENG